MERCAEPFEDRERRLDRGTHTGFGAFAEILAGDAEAHAVDPVAQPRERVVHRPPIAGAVTRIRSSDGRVHQRAILDAPRERPDLVE